MSFQSLEGFVLNVMSWSVCIHLSSFSCSMSYSISLLSVWMCWRVSCVGYCDLSCLRSWIFCLVCLLQRLKLVVVPNYKISCGTYKTNPSHFTRTPNIKVLKVMLLSNCTISQGILPFRPIPPPENLKFSISKISRVCLAWSTSADNTVKLHNFEEYLPSYSPLSNQEF